MNFDQLDLFADDGARLEEPRASHGAQYSPEVLEIFTRLIPRGVHVHDPFAGAGERLGLLADVMGFTFTGTELEPEYIVDRRVVQGSAFDPDTYPPGEFWTVFSPPYENVRLSDYAWTGPLPTTNTKGRRDYAIWLGRALSPGNTALYTGRHKDRDGGGMYWALHGRALDHCREHVIVNVDQPISAGWLLLLEQHGYEMVNMIPAYTQRYGGLDNADVRADHEVVIVARRAR